MCAETFTLRKVWSSIVRCPLYHQWETGWNSGVIDTAQEHLVETLDPSNRTHLLTQTESPEQLYPSKTYLAYLPCLPGICLTSLVFYVLYFRFPPAEYSDWDNSAPLLLEGNKQVREERQTGLLCFPVPLCCPLVLCNHVRASWHPEVSVINGVHVTPPWRPSEQVVRVCSSVPRHISVLSKNHWHVPSNSKNV